MSDLTGFYIIVAIIGLAVAIVIAASIISEKRK